MFLLQMTGVTSDFRGKDTQLHYYTVTVKFYYSVVLL
jgi:hypothetical protein